MTGLLARLNPAERDELLEAMNYLNMQEIKALCDRHRVPYRIVVELPGGGTKSTSDTDRKPVILERWRSYLATGEVPQATRLPARIVRADPPPARLGPSDRIYYRWYNKTYEPVMNALKELTGGRFRNGALARVLIMDFWTRGIAPTFKEFAQAWTVASADTSNLVTAEYAYLTDVGRGEAGPEWKRKRQQKAKRALALLATVGR